MIISALNGEKRYNLMEPECRLMSGFECSDKELNGQRLLAVIRYIGNFLLEKLIFVL